MKFEEVLPALRAGKKVRRSCWPVDDSINFKTMFPLHKCLARHDWEIVPEPKHLADYLVKSKHRLSVLGSYFPTWIQETHEVGKQPADAVLVLGSERDVTE